MLKEAMSRGYCCLNFTKAIIVISRTLRMRSSFAYHLLAAFESSNLPSKYVKPQYITIMHLIFNPPPPRLPPAQKKKLHNYCSQDLFWILQSQEDKRNVLQNFDGGGGGDRGKGTLRYRENGKFVCVIKW